MSDPIMPLKTIYLLRQRVEIVEHEPDRPEPVRDSADRQSLLLLETSVQEKTWKRSLEEYILSPGQLETMATGRSTLMRGELLSLHHRALKGMKIRYGLQSPLMLQSDGMNRDVGLPASGGTSPPTWQVLHLPTFLPEIPEAWDAGSLWENYARVRFGMGRFPIKYTARVLSAEQDRATVQVDLEPQKAAMSRDGFTLTLHPAGSWTAVISIREAAAISCKGNYEIRVHGRLESKDGVPRQADLLTCMNVFEYERIPVRYDQRLVYPARWVP